jgi:hypothetical protein
MVCGSRCFNDRLKRRSGVGCTGCQRPLGDGSGKGTEAEGGGEAEAEEEEEAEDEGRNMFGNMSAAGETRRPRSFRNVKASLTGFGRCGRGRGLGRGHGRGVGRESVSLMAS